MRGPRCFLVVGAGSAGAVVAARLSENPAASVLLLEAGPDHDTAGAPAGVRSANFFNALGEPGRLWPDLVTTRAAGQNESLYVRGRGAGGSSSVNALCAIRGNADDYERWERELGCPGWGWSAMREAFARAETQIPLTRVPTDELPPLDRAIRAAARSLGYPESDDYPHAGATGISRIALTLRDGKRVSSGDAYLEPGRGRPNLVVQGDTVVDRVLLDGRRAVGVRTIGGDEIECDEVILDAGAIHSPSILLRSDIGVDDGLPVGANLKDHAATPGIELALRAEGRMRTAEAPVATSMLRYSSDLAGSGSNDMQLLWFSAAGPGEEALGGGRLFGAVMRVFSHGEVRLRSNDPRDDPIVEFRMLSDRRDLVRLRDAVHRMIEIVCHPEVAAICDGAVALNVPVEALATDDAVDAWLLAHVTDYVHAAGTCRMGTPGDAAAVVDTDCRVIGYEQLRVCDASVMPDLPRANTHLTTVAIAEHLAPRLA